MSTVTSWIIFLAVAILATFALLFLVFWLTWLSSRRENALSPYTGLPLRRATDLSYHTCEKVLGYLYDLKQYDNRIFRLSKAAYCRETGRLFPNCIDFLDHIYLDWSFLNRRYPGVYVSWGSLTLQQQKAIRDIHGSLEGFQTEESSPTPSPRLIEPEYCFTKPGPLYVNFTTKELLGWKIATDTDIEVLIVLKPIKPVKF